MLIEHATAKRELHRIGLDAELVVVGGGLAGTCCAVTAARAGARVVLVQDRPVLGGNASSEVRLWVLGATAHMGNNNRWAREGGVLDEILVENLYRNREGNPVIFDTILLEKAVAEENLTLLLNTAVDGCRKTGRRIAAVTAFCSQNSTRYDITARLFCDASGDGILGYLSGASYRMGAEDAEEFGEGFAPDPDDYGELLGHTIYFYSRDTGKPVDFVAPAYALKDITVIPRWRDITPAQHGCRYWWFEWGGRLDTVHDTERIKWELWQVVWGVWDYIKNSGRFPEARTMTLEWVGLIPGKRESRRFVGDYLLTQGDIIEQRRFDDAVAHGGWSIDLHPADGVYSPKPPCNQWHSRGVYQIPYRCLYSRDVANLFLAGRIISVSHVAFGSTRVMATCAAAGQAVGMAAAQCVRENLLPRDLLHPDRMQRLQRSLVRYGQHIPLRPAFPIEGSAEASSRLRLGAIPASGPLIPLTRSCAQLLPFQGGRVPRFTLWLHTTAPTTLALELRKSERPGSFTPDVILARKEFRLNVGQNIPVQVDFGVRSDPGYLFLCIMSNEHAAVHASEFRLTGLLSVFHRHDQKPPPNIGVEQFEFWCPERRPGGHNIALNIEPALDVFGPENVLNGRTRPEILPNAWVADPDDPNPTLTVHLPTPASPLRGVVLVFDTDFDHPMESVQYGHPERAVPFCVREYRLLDDRGSLLRHEQDNHQTRNTVLFDNPLTTRSLRLEILRTWGAPAAVFEVQPLFA